MDIMKFQLIYIYIYIGTAWPKKKTKRVSIFNILANQGRLDH